MLSFLPNISIQQYRAVIGSFLPFRNIIPKSSYSEPINSSEQKPTKKTLYIVIAIFIFFAGIVSISAMVLPGISGSTILLIFGLYAPILNAVKEVLHFNLEFLPVVVILGVGNVLGIALVI